MRTDEVCDLRIEDTQHTDETGRAVVRVTRRKGSNSTHIAQTPRLQKAIADALALHKADAGNNPWLVPGSKGGVLRKPTLDTAMQRLKRRMAEKELVSIHTYKRGKDDTEKPLFWTLQDLKRKGISDAVDARIGGHRSARMRELYDTDVEVFDAPK